jgi:hypothetical protein
MKDFFVEPDLSRFCVDADGEIVMAVGCSRRHPHLPAHHNGSGLSPVGNFCFPLNVVGFTPVEGKANRLEIARGLDMSVAGGPAKLRPIGSRDGGADDQHQSNESEESLNSVAAHGGENAFLIVIGEMRFGVSEGERDDCRAVLSHWS